MPVRLNWRDEVNAEAEYVVDNVCQTVVGYVDVRYGVVRCNINQLPFASAAACAKFLTEIYEMYREDFC